MQPASLLVLADLDAPKVKLALPLVRQGDRLKLNFKLERVKNGRAEVLLVFGEFRVASVAVLEDQRQEVTVEATGKSPSWRAVKKKAPLARKVGPSRFPRTVVS